MMKQFLEQSKLGIHKNCQICPWNPKIVGPIAFGVSCEEHGVEWSVDNKAVSMQVVQDPAGTTPGKTGRLCFVHNSKNPTDKTAQHAYDLWKATVSFDLDSKNDPYLKKHYWTNALLHGADKKETPELRKLSIMEVARKCCSLQLLEQINQLSPKIIIVNGEYAAKSLFDLGLISKLWNEYNEDFINGVYMETSLLSSGEKVTVFCTYHTAITPINTHIARLYSSSLQLKIDHKLHDFSKYNRVNEFLNKYPSHEPEGRGMRVLLLHWLEIGKLIRESG